jgi:tetratricopeptide (TPR) repeat protein
MQLALCFLVLSLQIALAGGPPKTWKEWVSEGRALADAGNYRVAAQAFEQALTAAGGCNMTDRERVRTISFLAYAYAEAGQYAESERAVRHALEIVQKTDGADSLDYALLLGNAAVLPTHSGNREAEKAILREAIAAHARTGSARDLAMVRACLAQILMQQKRYGEAETVLLDSQPDFARLKMTYPQLLSDLLNGLGLIRYAQGRFAEAVEAQRGSLNALEDAVGAEHPSLVVSLNNLATTFVRMGHLEEGGSTYQRAITVCTKTLGEDHPNCGVLLENYAFVLRKLGRKREAKQMAARSKQIELASRRRNGEGAVVSMAALQSDGK